MHKDIQIGEDKFNIGTELMKQLFKIIEANIKSIDVSKNNSITKGPYLLQTLLNDKNENKMTQLLKFIKS